MTKAYKVTSRMIQIGERKGETVYSVRPVSYGILSADDVARQIAMESSSTPGDVKAVLDRYAYYVIENLKKGYSIELLGFGTLYLRFITTGAVTDEKQATASLVKRLVPAFRPSFSIVNGTRIYDLVPEKIQLVKYDKTTDSEENDDTSEEGNTPDSGSSGNGGDDGNNPL